MTYNNSAFLSAALNKTTTTNGAAAFNSTLSDFLDFYYFAGTALPAQKKKTNFEYFGEKSREVKMIVDRFVIIFDKNPDYAMRLLYELRDIRSPIGGRGKRNIVALIYRYLADKYPAKFAKQLSNIVEYGSWRDLLWLMDTKVEKFVIDFWWNQIKTDTIATPPTLAAKWFPSENSGKRSAKFFQKFAEVLEMHPAKIRKTIGTLRKRINLVESSMSANEWAEIQYDKLPSRAGKIYGKSFGRHDGERYTKFIKAVERGEKKLNVAHVEMFELFKEVTQTSQAQFQEIIKMIRSWMPENFNVLAMVDTSGSMEGWTGFMSYSNHPQNYTPMQIAIPLGIALAKSNNGKFENALFEFSDNAKLHYLPSNNFKELYNYVEKKFKWQGSTNVMSAIQQILKIAVTNKLPEAEMPKMLVVLSDMQFNQHSYNQTTFEAIKTEYAKAGYNVPVIVWWGINGNSQNVPVVYNNIGTIAISGHSQSLIKTIVTGAVMPIEVIKNIVDHERYNKVVW